MEMVRKSILQTWQSGLDDGVYLDENFENSEGLHWTLIPIKDLSCTAGFGKIDFSYSYYSSSS